MGQGTSETSYADGCPETVAYLQETLSYTRYSMTLPLNHFAHR